MAFSDQVEALTGLTISASGTNPTNDQLSQFLKDGVIDVTNKWIASKPQDIELFGRESSISDSQGLNVGGARIISVIREAGADGSSDGSTAWEPCRKIPISIQSRAVDPDSLSYASQYNPVFTINSDKTINVYPVPSSNNGFKVFYVNEEPRDISNNAALIHSHSNIKYFPNDKVYLVVLYASIQSLQAAMSNNIISLNINSPVAPTMTTVIFTSVDSSLDATSPIFTTTPVSAASIYTGSAPTYAHQSAALDFSKINTYIDTTQDVELASAKLQEVGTQLQEMNAKMQNSLNAFNKENVAYQSAIQESMLEMQASNQTNLAKAQADLELAITNKDRDLQRQLQNGINDMQAIVADNQARLSKYQAEVGDYQAEVAKKVQENTTKTQQYQNLYIQLLQQYNAAFQVAQPQQQGGR